MPAGDILWEGNWQAGDTLWMQNQEYPSNGIGYYLLFPSLSINRAYLLGYIVPMSFVNELGGEPYYSARGSFPIYYGRSYLDRPVENRYFDLSFYCPYSSYELQGQLIQLLST